jgi:hypothetical protein
LSLPLYGEVLLFRTSRGSSGTRKLAISASPIKPPLTPNLKAQLRSSLCALAHTATFARGTDGFFRVVRIIFAVPALWFTRDGRSQGAGFCHQMHSGGIEIQT